MVHTISRWLLSTYRDYYDNTFGGGRSTMNKVSECIVAYNQALLF